MFTSEIKVSQTPDNLLPINHTFDRFFWNNYYIITKEIQHHDNTAVLIIFELDNYDKNILHYRYVNHIYYFRSDLFCKINTFVSYKIISIAKNIYIQICFDQESYILNTSNNELSKSHILNDYTILENTPTRIANFQQMIKEFDKSTLNDALQIGRAHV